MISELSCALSIQAPEMTETPIGQRMTLVNDPRWYTEPSKLLPGSLLCFRDPGSGWVAYNMPSKSVAELIGFLANQLAAAPDISTNSPH